MSNEKILVVDDDKNICELLRLYLVKEGYGVTIANDGTAALQEFDKLHPDLVLLDVMMPGMARKRHLVVEAREQRMEDEAASLGLNRVEMRGTALGVPAVFSGACA